MNYYNCVDRIYLSYCNTKDKNYRLGLRRDRELIESIKKDLKYIYGKEGLTDIIKGYLDVIFAGHEELLTTIIEEIKEGVNNG